MKIRDLPIRKRLLLSNFIMIFIPVMFLLTLSIAIFLSLQFGNINRASIISFIWPESGSTLSIQFELSRLRVRADQYAGSLNRLKQSSNHLEEQGLKVAIYQGDMLLYHTRSSDADAVMERAYQERPSENAAISWSDTGLVFHYLSDKTNVRFAVVGDVPIRHSDEFFNLESKDVLKIAFYAVFLIALLLTVFIGLYLSRCLAIQIIRPLENLRNIADDISQGNLDHPVVAGNYDEIGDTCRAFEKMRLQLKAAEETRNKYDHNRKELIAGISHDLSTPLTKIEGYTCGLIDGIANTPEKRKHYLQMILDTSKNMGRLVQTLFLFSKLDLGQIPFHWETVDICTYLDDYISEQDEHFRGCGMILSFQRDTSRAMVSIDRTQFQRVVENIIANSIKYKKEVYGHLQIHVQRVEDKRIRLIFMDDGPGVRTEELSQIFESFYRTDKARTDVAKGSGLGLAVVNQIVREMKGRIWAERTIPHGLTICIDLPEVKGAQHEKSVDY